MLRELEATKALEIQEVDYFGYRKKEYIPLESPDIDRLSRIEQEVLDEVINFVCFDNTAQTISEFSHNQAWETVGFGEVLPYYSAFSLFPTQVSLETLEWAEGETAKIEAERSKEGALEYKDFSDFRRSVLAALGRA